MITLYELEGIKKGERATLIRLIEKKFGPVDDVRKDYILNEIGQDRIRSLLLVVLDATSMKDLNL